MLKKCTFFKKNAENILKIGYMETQKERLKQFIEAMGFSVREFERAIGVSSSTITHVKDNLSAKLKERISANFQQLNMDWLLTGRGEMLKQEENAEKTQNKRRESTEAPSRRRIPLYSDITSVGGYNDQIAEVDKAAAAATEWIDAGDWFPEATAAIRPYGDSMVEYPAGSILVLKRVQDRRLLINGRNYVIETTEFRITKQLQYDGGDYLMAYSSNPETYPDGRQIHSPIKIPLDTVRHIDLVLGCVQKEYSNGAIPIIQN